MVNDDAYQTDNTYDHFYPVTWQPKLLVIITIYWI
jgi:hypothetical protein